LANLVIKLSAAQLAEANVHPNLIPVHCWNQDDMRKLAAEMREVCLKDPDKIEEYQASPSEITAKFKSEMVKDDMISSGHLRFIHYTVDGRLTNVVYTLMENSEGKQIWNLSMSHANPKGPQRVADDLATMIAQAFLEDDYEEVEAKAYWKAIRHFAKEKK